MSAAPDSPLHLLSQVSAVRGAGGLCVAAANGSVLLLLLALLLLPHLTATGKQSLQHLPPA